MVVIYERYKIYQSVDKDLCISKKFKEFNGNNEMESISFQRRSNVFGNMI